MYKRENLSITVKDSHRTNQVEEIGRALKALGEGLIYRKQACSFYTHGRQIKSSR